MGQSIPFIGIDAAFRNTGLVSGSFDLTSGRPLLNNLELISTAADKANKKTVRKNSDDIRRAQEILKGIDKMIDETGARFAFVEVPTGTQSARASWTLGIAVGIIAHVSHRCALIQVSPGEVKNVVGEKHPDKEQMIAWAVKSYPNLNWPVRGGKIVAGRAEHLADAVAAVHAGIATDEFQRTIAMFASLR